MNNKIILLDALPPRREMSEEDIVKLVEDAIADYKKNNPDGIRNEVILDSMTRTEKINNALKTKFTKDDLK